jgi:hypothetical protein
MKLLRILLVQKGTRTIHYMYFINADSCPELLVLQMHILPSMETLVSSSIRYCIR